MPVHLATTVEESRRLLADAPSPVVVIPVYNSYDDVVCCVSALTMNTPASIAVLVIDDGGEDQRAVALLSALSAELHRLIVVLRHARNEGYVRACNDGFASTPGRDVVILNSDVVVGAEWLERLTSAALSSDTVATASTLTNHGTIVSVPHRNQPTPTLPGHMSPHEAARVIAAESLSLRPVLPTAVGHCTYLRRTALDLLGWFDEAFNPGYGEEVDFSQRAIAHGFCHVLADDVFTFHRGGASFGDTPAVTEQRARHEALVNKRYPWYRGSVVRAENDIASPLAHALGNARRSLLGLSIGIDGLCLGPHRMGTQEVIVQTIRALSRRSDITRLVVFAPLAFPRYLTALRDQTPDVEYIGMNPYLGIPERVVDVIYRPYQVSDIVELDFLHRAGDRFVVNQLDMIAYGNPAYFATHEAWVRYRDIVRLSLELAHGIAYPSEFSHRSVVNEGLEAPGKPWALVSCGLDHEVVDGHELRPPSVPGNRPFLLCVGASYHHKNRRFALELWAELRRRGWCGTIVMVGPTPPHGSSLAAEAEFLLRVPEIRADAIILGAVEDTEKRWLYRHAALVLYPSVIEGFGFVPFEAAQHGTATLTTRGGSLDETLTSDLVALESFDVADAVDRAWRLLHDARSRADLVAALRQRGTSFTWDSTADKLMELFRDALRQPRGRVIVLEGEYKLPVGLAARSERRNGAATNAFSFERLVRAVIARPNLKQGLSPDGSRRQRAARLVIQRARKTSRSPRH